MKFNAEEWLERARKDFESAWLDSEIILSERPLSERYPLRGYEEGKAHPVFDTIQKLREAYLRLGFSEVINPLIVDEVHVRKQFSKEALAVLDRCYYLAGLPRPNVGISEERIRKIEKITEKNFDPDELRKILHIYKKGKIDGDDLSAEIARVLGVEDQIALKVIDEVFPEFKTLMPEPTTLTLRSHMTTGWFITLSKLSGKYPLPVKLFSIDRCFRREQSEDPTRLYTYFSASCVIMAEDVSVDDGKAVAEALLRHFGFEKFRFRKDDKRSKYYIPGTQTEVFAYHPHLENNRKYADGWIEIATFGIYSPTALAEYDIEYPVMNLGLGVERLAMVLHDYSDVREMVYGFKHIELSDLDIARKIKLKDIPLTPKGIEIASRIIQTFEENATAQGPCEFTAYRGKLFEKDVEIFVFERENAKLCGPAYANEIVVHDGNIYGIPKNEKFRNLFDEGVSTGIRYVDSFAYCAVRRIEEMVAEGRESGEVRSRVVENLSDINLKLEEGLMNYLISRGKSVDVRGPLFLGVGFRLL
ncbi:O-phosphoserine--tRNA ligase [Geoglobus acetivorans]|uniref:O-phosphoserine--tRNA(Cys) ligase n=1 Tax=Geoglobus acetivorans TaxID=565033 RepID=A0ABZ3H3A5_GEOAI|nr:O-phosphoserine--tRNA ligase [Geoglobus acetivorans]